MTKITVLAFGLAGLALTGCEHIELVSHTMSARDWGNPEVYDAAKATAPAGSAYTAALAKNYMALAAEEKGEGDLRNYERWSRKALLSSQGVVTDPELPERWDLELVNWQPRKVNVSYAEAYEQRTRLMNAFWKCTRNRAPEAAAMAQSSFDSWIEELEEGWEVTAIESAKANFLSAVAKVEASCPPGAPPQRYVVYFSSGSAAVGAQGHAVAHKVAHAVNTASAPTKVYLVWVTASTDTVGKPDYNQALSERRVNAVKNELVQVGVPEALISTEATGESKLPVATGDNVNNQKNRSATIIVDLRPTPPIPLTPPAKE
ncbi:MAG: OmpA family protein [Azospirillum sp.]|nr:OmpA family protein [Azospirillum sp.]